MAKGRKIDLGMKDVLDEMFMDDAGRKENRLPKIYDIPLDMIDDFPDHPFKVRLDEDMDQLVESIKERGLITPITLRQKDDGRYEIVSGHRRKKACEIAGLETVRAEIKELSRDEAIILMVESNLQRSVILPSEKAFSYKMRLEAMKRQGQRTDATLSPVATKLPIDSAAEIGAMTGESRDQVFRYIRLTNLIPEILDMVDEKKIAFNPAVELSYLKSSEQKEFLEAMDYAQASPSLSQAQRLKKLSQEGGCTLDAMCEVMNEIKKDELDHVTIKNEVLRKYFPKSYTPKQMQDTIIRLLEKWQRSKQRDMER